MTQIETLPLHDIVFMILLLLAIAALLYLSYINRRLHKETKQNHQLNEILLEKQTNTQFWLETLLKHSPDIICFKDGKGRWLEANPADLELFQLQNIDYQGKTDSELAEFTHPLYKEAFLACETSDRDTWALGKVVRCTEVIPAPDAAPIHLDVVKIPLFDKQKKPSGLLVIGRDISDHIKVQEQLGTLNDAYRLTNKLRHLLIHASTETNLLHDICHLIVQQEGFCLAWVGHKVEDKQQSIQLVAEAGFNTEFTNNFNLSWQDDCAPAQTIRTGKLQQSNQICNITDIQKSTNKCYCQSVISLPLKIDNSIWGVLVLYHTNLTISSIHLLEGLAEDLSFGLQSLQSRQSNKLMTKLVHKNEQFLHTVIDSLTHPFMVIDARTYNIELANKASRKLINTATNKSCYHISHHRDSPCDGKEHPCPLTIIRKTLQPTVVEHIHYNAQGDEINVEVHAFPILNAQGELERFIEYALDITPRKQAENALKKLNLERQIILDTLPLGIVWLKERKLIWANPFLLKILYLNEKEALNLTTEAAYPCKADYEEMEQISYPLMAKGETFQTERQMRRNNGELFWCRLTGKNVDPKNPHEGSLWIIEDINEEYQMKQDLLIARDAAEAGNRSKSTFLANMSHEIRTPMNAIIGLSALVLQSNNLPDKQHDQISKVHQSAQSLIGILNDILDLSKIEAEKLELEELDFQIQTVLDNLHNMIDLKASEKGLKLDFQLDPEIPSFLKGDPLRLSQILINLGNNAIKFTHEGSISIQIELIEQHKQQIKLAFSISDTGIGISQQQQETLFQPFNQADSSTTRHYGGSGLGLTICKKLVTLMGGEITLNSKLDKGSRFYFTLPFAPGSKDAKKPGFNNIDDALKQLKGARILLVEDNKLNQELASELLRLNGIKVTTAWHGREALELLEKHCGEEHCLEEQCFDGILMDIQMPVMDGYTASRQIRSQPRFNNLPIIAMTANVMIGDRDKAKAAGMNDHIGKPLNVKQMFSTMAQWIKPEPVSSIENNAPTSGIKTDDENKQFSVLTGINTEQGLTNTLDNSSLYSQLLGYFHTDLTQFMDNMHTALMEPDLSTAIRLAHTLKGTAATIGANDISRAAKALEIACKEAHTPESMEILLSNIENAIKEVTQGLDIFFTESQTEE